MNAAISRDERPTILVRTDEHEVADEAIRALCSEPNLYHRDGTLVRVVHGKPPLQCLQGAGGWTRIEALPPAALREMLASRIRFVRLDKKGEEHPAHPPDWLVSEIAARGQWPGIRVLVGVTSAPLLRPDGTILQSPGYDESTGLLYEPEGDQVEIKEHPTLEDARYAVESLRELVVDFPFGSDGHRAVFLAAVLTPFARHAFRGPAPMFVIDANTPGTGKSLLADVIGMIATGHPMARMPYVKSDEEMRKRITAVAMQGDRLCLIDNVAGVLGGPSLDAALTSETWRDRVLGESRTTREISLHAVWYATGNNVELGADTGRRALPVRLESRLERPEERSGFTHADLLRHVELCRMGYVKAALTILRAYHVARRPRVELQPFGSYEGWSKYVRAALVWCGCPDPCSTRVDMLAVADHEGELIRRVVAALEELIVTPTGLTTGEIATKLRGPNGEKHRAAFVEWVGRTDEGGLPPLRSLGMKLHRIIGRVVAGKLVQKVGPRWVVKTAQGDNSTGTSRTSSASPARDDGEDEEP